MAWRTPDQKKDSPRRLALPPSPLQVNGRKRRLENPPRGEVLSPGGALLLEAGWSRRDACPLPARPTRRRAGRLQECAWTRAHLLLRSWKKLELSQQHLAKS